MFWQAKFASANKKEKLENKIIDQNISEKNRKENLAENVMHFKKVLQKNCLVENCLQRY